jgi:hypothetical protein
VQADKEALDNVVDLDAMLNPEEDYNPWWEGAKAGGKEFAKHIMPLTMSLINLDETKTRTKYQRQGIDNYSKYYMANLAQVREQMESPNVSNTFATNWGQPNLGFDYRNLSTFQSSRIQTGTIFNSSNPTNINFSPIPVTQTTLPGSSATSTQLNWNI